MNKGNYKHGFGKTRLYHIWKNMKQRCDNTNSHKYYIYGARGITVCDEWKNDFMIFYNWSMNNGYKDNLSIDRIDNEKGYNPENCRWVNNKTQANNRRNNILITYDGVTNNLKQWSEVLNIPYSTLRNRYVKYKTIFKEEIKK